MFLLKTIDITSNLTNPYFIFQLMFGMCFIFHFQALMMKSKGARITINKAPPMKMVTLRGN